ncbi:Bacitracin export ATP-binding protein BceA [compost metagenome]
MNSSDVILSVNGLTKTYKGMGYKVNALRDVTIQVKKGEFLTIMGTSGSGKSTLLNLIGALDVPDQGSVLLNGKQIDEMFVEPNATKYRSENIGFIFQSYNLLKDLSVEENLALPLILKNFNKLEIEKSVSKILEVIGLEKWKKHRPVQLSGGQQQRVAIGRALITKPPILLADEPTGNLDFNTTSEILNVFVDLKKKFNQCIVLVTHDPLVATYSDRVLFFHDGQVVDEYQCTNRDQDMNHILTKFKGIMVNS